MKAPNISKDGLVVPSNFYQFPKSEPLNTLGWGALGAVSVALTDKACSLCWKPPVQHSFTSFDSIVKKGRFFPILVKSTQFAVIIPLFEEGVYRGLLRQAQIHHQQTDEKESIASIFSRSIVNSCIFTATHFQSNLGLKGNGKLAVPIFISGMVYNGLVEATGNIWASVFAHSLGNSSVVFSLLVKSKGLALSRN